MSADHHKYTEKSWHVNGDTNRRQANRCRICPLWTTKRSTRSSCSQQVDILKKKCILCTFSRILIKIKKINYAELQRCLADAVQLCLRRYCWQYESIHLEDHSVSCFLEYNIAEGLIHIRWSSFWILINCTLLCQLQFLQPLELQELITLTSS